MSSLFQDNLSEHVVKSPRDILDLLKRGASMRTTGKYPAELLPDGKVAWLLLFGRV